MAAAIVLKMRRARSPDTRATLAIAGLLLLTLDLGVHNAGSRLNAESADGVPLLIAETAHSDPVLQFLSSKSYASYASYASQSPPDRVEFIDAGALWANAPMVFGIRATQGYNPLRYGLYEQVAGAQEVFGPDRPFTPLLPAYDGAMFDLLGVRYIVSGAGVPRLAPPGGVEGFTLLRDDVVKVWENAEALPPVLSATHVYLARDLERDIADGPPAAVDYRTTVVLAKLPSTLGAMPVLLESPAEIPGSGPAQARVLEYRNTRVSVATQSARDTILVLHDPYYPYWRVYVDGQERELLQANYLFRGVHVPAGEHTVTFRFEPFSWSAVRATFQRLR